MQFTDIFIRRPVLAIVVSLLILVLGLRSAGSLPVLQYPRTENAVVTISTTYYGADPDVVAGFITTPLEAAIAQASGIDYLTSSSTSGTSTITAYLRLNYDANKALTEISTKVNSVINQLPTGTQFPEMSVKVGQTIDAMYIGFNSDVLPRNRITDYLTRVVQPKLQTVEGVQTAEILGGQNFALRAWLDPARLAAYGMTAAEVAQALAQNDYISGLGNTKGEMVEITLNASTTLHSAEEFANLVLKGTGAAIVRLKDVARVELGADYYDAAVLFDGKPAVYIGIQVAPAANLLDVIGRVRKVFPGIRAQLPQGLNAAIVYDSTKFVNSSIDEVITSLAEATVIVTLVVFAFLGSVRSVFIPVIAIPLSLIGAVTLMLVMGFSINLLTLLALVLAIGLVVDDAIIVVENVNRHLDEGVRPIPAAILAARELGGPIIAMTVVLAAVYVPIGFQGGLTGALFTEFAFTLVATVTISAVVALTLSPMVCSRLL
jgi:multidrug efflux pump